MDFNQFIKVYDEYNAAKQPKNLFRYSTKLAEETGEVAEACLAFSGNKKKQTKIAEMGQTPAEHLNEELADVIIVALHIAHIAKLDREELFKQAIEKMKRKTEIRKQKIAAKQQSSPDTHTNQ